MLGVIPAIIILPLLLDGEGMSTPKSAIKVGDKIRTWWQPTGSTILEILRYSGKHPDWFDMMLVLTAPRTKAGKWEMPYNSSEFPDDHIEEN
jgi:hypothetical protein